MNVVGLLGYEMTLLSFARVFLVLRNNKGSVKDMRKGEIRGLMRVVKYNRSFSVVKSYTTWEITIPCKKHKDAYARIWLDALAIKNPMRGDVYIGQHDNVVDKFEVMQYRASMGDYCLLVIPSYGIRPHLETDFVSLMEKERKWHSEHGWFYA
jgi:hypothetical protein